MLLGHLHNQDAIFGSQANQGDQAHLGVNVEINRTHGQEGQGAQHCQGYGHQDDHRGDIALVLSRQHQIHHQNAQAKDKNTGITG